MLFHVNFRSNMLDEQPLIFPATLCHCRRHHSHRGCQCNKACVLLTLRYGMLHAAALVLQSLCVVEHFGNVFIGITAAKAASQDAMLARKL